MKEKKETEIIQFIRKTCLGKTKEECNQAELNFLRYIELIERINDRIEREKKEMYGTEDKNPV